ncbi:hypothetical protein K431DRAFT_313092 [Polychaeton citri CBS 116435]|uniref:GRIP domain-containing protein n=1 Tax=Polychaeton citri CBS 116435 TaxID=1314669 RepID=A0A9P4Q9H2_9PEZI|nr:hypothetical protein K431DRAFT_313092 [Polychaeton citri CBS 116435]
MSAVISQDPTKIAAKKKNKKNKKKGNANKQDDGALDQANGTKNGEDEDDVEDEQEASEAATRNGSQQDIAPSVDATDAEPGDTTARLDAMQAERDNLRAEVTHLRQQLESIQQKHDDDLSSMKEDLETTQQDKEHAEDQYRNLLGKVNTIRSQLGERLKADAAELEETRNRIEELESNNTISKEENERLHEQVASLNSQLDSQNLEAETLRSRTKLSTSNWAKERDELVSREAYVREEYEVARQAMQDWEILATEERSRREVLEERYAELEDRLNSSQEAYERMKNESDTQSNAVDGLQRALRELQEERKRELREMVEQSQTQLDEMKKQAKDAEDAASQLKQQLETTQRELDRALPFEKEVKEKSLQIGKLRHEAVILNDHLTKALRFLKRGKPEDNVDRQLVTNHFLHFLHLDRSDPKKFQVLQLIAALLSWDEQQKEQAGLLRAGTGTLGTLKVPSSPFRRTPSTPSLSTDTFSPDGFSGPTSKESLAELWSDFLDREAQAGGATSRRGSISSSSALKGMRSPSLTSGTGLTSPVGRMSPELKRKESEGQQTPK